MIFEGLYFVVVDYSDRIWSSHAHCTVLSAWRSLFFLALAQIHTIAMSHPRQQLVSAGKKVHPHFWGSDMPFSFFSQLEDSSSYWTSSYHTALWHWFAGICYKDSYCTSTWILLEKKKKDRKQQTRTKNKNTVGEMRIPLFIVSWLSSCLKFRSARVTPMESHDLHERMYDWILQESSTMYFCFNDFESIFLVR